MVTILALAVVSAMALAVASAMVSAMTTAVASALRLPLLAMSLLSGRSGNNKNYGSRSAPTAMPHNYVCVRYKQNVSQIGKILDHTANVLSAEIADECLQTKSKDNLQ